MRLLKCQYRKAVDFEALKAAGFDAVSYNIPTNGTSGLRSMIDGAHAAGMRLGAWIAFGVDAALVRKWPGAGGMLDFSQEAARIAVAQVISNLLQQFPDLDIIAIDYMRYYTTTDDTALQESYSTHITDTVERIAEAAEGKTIIAHVKAYKNDWLRWCQNWPLWLDENLVDLAAPMCYQPLSARYGGFTRHAQAWLDVADQERILPTLAIIDTSTEDEALKTAAVITQEIRYFVDELGYTDMAFFDNRMTDEQRITIAAALPVPQEEPTKPDYTEIITALKTEASELRGRASILRVCAQEEESAANTLETEAARLEAL